MADYLTALPESAQSPKLALGIVRRVGSAPVRLETYKASELHFAFSYRVYLRWHTHRSRPLAPLQSFNLALAQETAAPFDIHLLEVGATETEVLMLASLQPSDAVSVCASKLKGQLSKWLRHSLQLPQPTSLLGNGYFACTVGESTKNAVERYLEKQPAHHGYASRTVQPVHVRQFRLGAKDEAALNPKHARAVLRFHFVFATWKRMSVFGGSSGEVVANHWRDLQTKLRTFAVLKVSFLPDHVHLAVHIHPSTSPSELVTELLNAAQETMGRDFSEDLVEAGIPRLWQPSAYLGSYGDISSQHMANYIRKWRDERRD